MPLFYTHTPGQERLLLLQLLLLLGALLLLLLLLGALLLLLLGALVQLTTHSMIVIQNAIGSAAQKTATRCVNLCVHRRSARRSVVQQRDAHGPASHQYVQ